ncbi:MAG: hypothetical protein O3A47_09875 [Chloroflexi bacterium]|nr:hypothetical protein [Chloroflexota bacterium]
MTITVPEDDVRWATSDGEPISAVRSDVIGTFFIKDGALSTRPGGTATWGNTPVGLAGNDRWNLTNGNITTGAGASLTPAGDNYT